MNILKNYLKVIVYDGFMYFDLCINVKSFNFIRNSNRIGDLENKEIFIKSLLFR